MRGLIGSLLHVPAMVYVAYIFHSVRVYRCHPVPEAVLDSSLSCVASCACPTHPDRCCIHISYNVFWPYERSIDQGFKKEVC